MGQARRTFLLATFFRFCTVFGGGADATFLSTLSKASSDSSVPISRAALTNSLC